MKLKLIAIFILSGLFFSSQAKEYKKLNNQACKIIFEVPTLGGEAGEAAWDEATAINEFYNSENAKLIKADSDIKIIFDSKNLIFNIDIPKMETGRPSKKCYLSDELDLRINPNISIYLDPKHDHGVYYRLIVDANGNKQDLRVDDESWWAEWTAEVKSDDNRIKAKIKIPIEKISGNINDGDIWGFNITIDGISDKGTLSSTPIKLRLADAQYFGHLLFRGNLNSGKIADIKSSLPDFHKNQIESKLAANIAICGPELKNIDGEIKDIKVGSKITLKNGTKATCLGLDNKEIIRTSFPFFYEKYDNKQLQRLRNQYSLEDIIEPGKNEFEKLLILNEWLVKHIEFGAPPDIRPDAFHILRYGLNGQTFFCTYLSFTLMQMYCSLGYTARKLTSDGHSTIDVWSNYWRKWIQIDPSHNSYFRLKGTAVPLNSNEIRHEFWKNKGLDLESVYGTEQRAEQVTLETREKDGAMKYRQEGYQWVAYKSRNNFFEIPFTYWNFDYLMFEDEFNADKAWTYHNKTCDRDILATRTNNSGDIFWTLNQAYIHLYDEGNNVLKVQLETVTPNFKTFEVSFDKCEWEETPPIFDWELHTGQNFLYARSINKFGIIGPEHKIVLNVD